jgi:hypothetical protein
MTRCECKVCGQRCSGGVIEHSKACYALSEDGGGAFGCDCEGRVADDSDLEAEQELSAELAAEIDALNAALDSAEQCLRDLRIGVTANVPLHDVAAVLFFKKRDKEWSLCVETAPGDLRAVRKASLEIRRAAALAVPALVEAVMAAAVDRIEATREARMQLEGFVNGLRKGRYAIERK